jgi:N-acetylmuramoyl-L-alanine amidase
MAPLKIIKIYIDIGHGEHGDPGAVFGKLIEHQMAIITANALAEELRYYGYIVKVEQGDLEIGDTARVANAWGADLFISVHYNAGGGDRGEVIYSTRQGSQKLAETLALGLKAAGQTAVKTYTRTNSFGRDYYGVLRISTMPAVIVEPAFVDNANDNQLVDTEGEQKLVGKRLAEAIVKIYGSNKEEEEKVVYKTYEDVPEWGKPVIKKLIDHGNIMVGEGGAINISQDMLRVFVILEREGVIK